MKKKYYYILVITGIIVLSLRCYVDPKTSSELNTQNNNAMVETLKLQAKVSGDGIPLVLVPGGLSSNLPNSQIIELPGGHAPHIVSRDKFNRIRTIPKRIGQIKEKIISSNDNL
jgi:hypothetical protein